MAWKHHSDPFNLVDRPHKAKKARAVHHGSKSHRGYGHMKYLSLYGTKYNPFHAGKGSGKSGI